MILLALDPGGTTGWSLWRYTAIEPLTLISYGMVGLGLTGFLHWWQENFASMEVDEIVIEDFVLDGRTPRPDTTALELIGATIALSPVPVIRQRNVAKIHATDEMLKRSGLWWRGAGHDRDSAKHALALVKTRRHVPTIARYWGRNDLHS